MESRANKQTDTWGFIASLFTYPSICFWCSIILGVSGVISPLLIYYFDHAFNKFPSIIRLSKYEQSGPVYRWFGTLNIIPFFLSLNTVRNHFSKNIKSESGMARRLLKWHLIASVVVFVSYVLMIELDPYDYWWFQVASMFSFILSGAIYHIVVDYLYAIHTNYMMNFSYSLSAISFFVACGAFLIKFITYFTGKGLLNSIANIASCYIFSYIFFKFIFVGVLVIGQDFFDTDMELFKSTAQTIL